MVMGRGINGGSANFRIADIYSSGRGFFPSINSPPRGTELRPNRSLSCLAFIAAFALGAGSRGWAQFGAREIAAMEDMRNLETALDFCFFDNGYILPLEALDDVDFVTNPSYNYIGEGNNGTRVIRAETGRFNTFPVNLLLTWLGPYINFQPGTTQIGIYPYDQGSPLDPWGTPYLFYSPLGLLRGDTGTVTLEFHGDVFDRYTIVSLGADGLPSADDLIRPIGAGVAGTPSGSGLDSLAVSSISGPEVRWSTSGGVTRFHAARAATLIIRGYRFGATQGGSKALFAGIELPPAQLWSDRRIEIDLPETISGTGDFVILVGNATSAPLTLIVAPNTAEAWEKYD